jgi:hypothetical protein
MPELLPSTVDVVVTWARANDNLREIFGNRVSTTLPAEDRNIAYPWLQVQRIIGEALSPEAPMDRARIQFNVWGGIKTNGLPDWKDADLGIRTLEAEIREFVPTVVEDNVIVSMSGLEGIMQLPDPDTNQARFWMDAIVTTRSSHALDA